MSYKPRLSIDALIFACNDLLINVNLSYKEVVRNTVQIYLQHALGLPESDESLITPKEVVMLQQIGNFTGYWELTQAFVLYFIEMLPPVPAPTFPSKFHVPGLLAYLQLAGGNLQISIDTLREQRDIPQFAKDVAAAGGGLDGAHKALPQQNRHMLVADGEVTKTNIVGRIFQELYLGASLFERVHGEPAIIVQNTGYCEHESLIIDRNILKQISKKLPLAVISNRPRSEVERSLKARKIDQYFNVIITRDEIREARANPIPDPWPLLETTRKLNYPLTNVAYIGTSMGDIQAAKAANKTMPFTAIGCTVNAYDQAVLRENFEQNKANMILGHPNNLKELILG